MSDCDSIKNKLAVFLISTVIVLISVALFFLDKSLGWCTEKIVSCVIVNLWLFFMPPSIRGSYIRNKDKSLAEWVLMGYRIGASGIWMPALIAPVFGMIYYLKRKKSDC